MNANQALSNLKLIDFRTFRTKDETTKKRLPKQDILLKKYIISFACAYLAYFFLSCISLNLIFFLLPFLCVFFPALFSLVDVTSIIKPVIICLKQIFFARFWLTYIKNHEMKKINTIRLRLWHNAVPTYLICRRIDVQNVQWNIRKVTKQKKKQSSRVHIQYDDPMKKKEYEKWRKLMIRLLCDWMRHLNKSVSILNLNCLIFLSFIDVL